MLFFANHKTIKKQNVDIYRNFFESNDLVVSANANFFWGGEYGVMESGPAIINLFPRKIFLGFSKTLQKKVEVDDYWYYLNDKNKFGRCSGDLFVGFYGQDKFNLWYQYLCSQGFEYGLKINVLSELPLDVSAGTQGNVAYLLSLASFLLLKKINKEDILDWKNKDIQWRLHDKKFLEVLYFSWSLEALFNNYNVSGVHSFAASLFEKGPVLFLKEGEIEQDLNKYFENSKINFSALKILENKINFDVAVIFSGKTKKTGQNVLKTLQSLQEREEIKIKNLEFLKENDFLRKFVKASEIKNTYFETAKILSWEILASLKGLLDKDEKSEEYFFTSINNYQSIFSLLGILGEGDVLNYVYEQLRILKINFKPIGSGGGGSLLLVDRYGELESKLSMLEKKLKEKGLFLEIYFFSNTDGWDVDGLQIDQFLSEGEKAEYIKERIFKALVYDCAKNTKEEIIITDFEDWLKKSEFVVDLDNKKIFIKGKKVTSDELHSAKVAAEILEKLVLDDFHIIRAENIEEVSYRNRYEIQSKIISPLTKLVKEKLGKKMPLEIKGELSNFNLKLGKANLKMNIVKEVI